MNHPINISKESYLTTLPFQFQGSTSTFTEKEYNPNLLNDNSYTIFNKHQKKNKMIIQEFIDVYNKIYQLTKKYNLGSISIENDELYLYVFIIKVSKKLKYKEVLQLWDKILDDVEKYCEQKEYTSFYKNISNSVT